MIESPIIIATRRSELALWQAEFVKNALEKVRPGIEVKLLGMTTSGDRWLNAPLAEIGGKGLFIKELEGALLTGKAKIAVHSMKDVPAVLSDGFSLPVIAFRDDPRDVLVSRNGEKLTELPTGARIGSRPRRGEVPGSIVANTMRCCWRAPDSNDCGSKRVARNISTRISVCLRADREPSGSNVYRMTKL